MWALLTRINLYLSRHHFWMRKLILIISSIVISYSYGCGHFTPKNQQYIRDRELEIVGTYSKDPSQLLERPYQNYDTSWRFIFRPDKTFSVTRQLPFIVDTVGSWKYVYGDRSSYLQLKFGNTIIAQQVLIDSSELIIPIPQPFLKNRQIEELRLIKRK